MEGVRDRLWGVDLDPRVAATADHDGDGPAWVDALLQGKHHCLKVGEVRAEHCRDVPVPQPIPHALHALHGPEVDAPGILAELAASAGLPTVTRRKLRDMRLSAQQGYRQGPRGRRRTPTVRTCRLRGA
jgi:hypothetical protein